MPETTPCARCGRTDKPIHHKALGICGRCHSVAKRSGEFGHPECAVPGCERTSEAAGLCDFHNKQRLRIDAEEEAPAPLPDVVPIDAAIERLARGGPTGWGPSDFDYSHPQFRRARREAFERVGGRCGLCGKPATDAHHWAPPGSYPPPEATEAKDITPLCHRCHQVATKVRQHDARERREAA